MSAATGGASEVDERVRASVHYSVAKICEAEGAEAGFTVTRETVAVLTELALRYSKTLAQDLEAFAKHARRTKVTVDDVVLCARKDERLLGALREYEERLAEELQASKRRRRGDE